MYYISARTLMKEATLQILNLINSISAIEDDIDKEQVENTIYDKNNLVTLNTDNIMSFKIHEKDFTFEIPTQKSLEKMSTIMYKRPYKEVEAVKKILNVSSNREVGEKTYEYYLSRECDFD